MVKKKTVGAYRVIEERERVDDGVIRSDPIPMASTEGLVPITRAFLASYYDKHPFTPLSADVSRLSSEIRSMANDLLTQLPPTQGFFLSFSSSIFTCTFIITIHTFLFCLPAFIL